MPFTPSHVAAALPFLHTPLIPAAVVIGSMAPDVPYFMPLGLPRDLTHSPLGLPTADLAITLGIFALWFAALRTPLLDLAPAAIRERIPRLSPLGWRPRDRNGRLRGWAVTLALVAASAIVGSITHLAWDAFTHRDSPLVLAWAPLRVELGPFHLYTWLQHISSVAGLAIVAVWAVRWVRRTPAIANREPMLSNRMRGATWLAVIVASGGTGLVVWTLGMSTGLSPFDGDLVFGVATRAGAAAGLVVVLIAAGWWLDYARRARVATGPSTQT